MSKAIRAALVSNRPRSVADPDFGENRRARQGAWNSTRKERYDYTHIATDRVANRLGDVHHRVVATIQRKIIPAQEPRRG